MIFNLVLTFGLLFCLSLFDLQVKVQAQGDYPAYVDIHFNASLKPFNSRSLGAYNIWEPIYHECGAGRSAQAMDLVGNRIFKQSQSNFETMIRGNVRLGCLNISPIEQQLISSDLLNDKNKRPTISCLTGIVANELFLRRKEIDYFEDLLNNLFYITRFEDRPYFMNGEEYRFNLLRVKSDIDSVLDNPNRLGYALTIQGGHSLGHSIYINEKITNTGEYRTLVLDNVRRLKGLLPLVSGTEDYLDVPILWIALSKTYNNGLGGEATSLNKAQQSFFKKQDGIGDKPSKLGEDVIDLLLSSKGGGRRILIDIKNMSKNFRTYYYEIIKSKTILGDNVPIVASHVGISNLGYNNRLYKSKDTDEKNNNSYLNHWERNLAAEDIEFIYRSNGLIGISLDKTVVAGQLALNEIKNTQPNSIQRRRACVKIFLANVFTVVDVIGNRRAWDLICVGSDYDDMLEPLDPYPTAEFLPELANDIIDFLNRPEDIGDLFSARRRGDENKNDFERLMFDYTPEEIAKKIMYQNARKFIQANLDETSTKPGLNE